LKFVSKLDAIILELNALIIDLDLMIAKLIYESIFEVAQIRSRVTTDLACCFTIETMIVLLRYIINI